MIDERTEIHSDSNSGALTFSLRDGEVDLDRERLACKLRLRRNEDVLSSELRLEGVFGASKKSPLETYE